MRIVDAAQIDELLDYPTLIEALADAFSGALYAPERHHHEMRSADRQATHLLMPAWTLAAPGPGAYLGTKIVNVFPGNAAAGLPAVMGAYLLQSGETGAPIALLDGSRLTLWRTAAASALAARFLARPGAARLTMVGAGALAPFLIRAHASVRPIADVTIWNRSRQGAERVAARLAGSPWHISIADDLETAVRGADIVSCATLTETPLVAGQWLSPGTHLDCVGAFNLRMREVDDETLRRAEIFVDSPAARTEGGDVALGLRSGVIRPENVLADLHELCTQQKTGRRTEHSITLFKSVGAAIEDLAAAMVVWRTLEPTLPS
jgi:ornithine cyclodeaminase